MGSTSRETLMMILGRIYLVRVMWCGRRGTENEKEGIKIGSKRQKEDMRVLTSYDSIQTGIMTFCNRA